MTAQLSRRSLLMGLACLAACSAEGSPDPAIHPALRVPARSGAVAMVRGIGTAEALALRAPDVLVGLSPRLAAGTPFAEGLTEMPPFPGEVLLPSQIGADAFIQVEGPPERLDALVGSYDVPWRTPVTRDVVTPTLQRNPFGFTEGQTGTRDILTPAGASLLAVRVIRMAHAQWDADPPDRQSAIIGRHPDGTWLTGAPAHTTPDFTADPDGATTPLDSHVRTMNPRTADTPAPAMLRRSWTHPSEGVVFMAFQSDLATGFARAQSRLAKDALHPYLLTTGGGYFTVPPMP
ncbi:Dyp-type peroxidase [Actinokineospora globicatena]|uniref:Dyp-type peroxidase C-terminal domain-containing protein n=1 Tax=Actinokineospora globicatena TaxID=103729 RepID=A0A9W6V6E6_9PSEU|nr:Dyp-type peroxidase domain-containing protein [Actinokineospora globicatena]GLW90302.1 hypothetical protein Aglo03_11180 [Actinokineospora globicatena]